MVLVLVLGLLLHATPVVGDALPGFVHASWSEEDGLPANGMTRLIQPRDASVRLATFDRLVRFDGVRSTVFNSGPSPGLPSNRIIDRLEPQDGSLSMLTEQRHVARFQHGVETLWVDESSAEVVGSAAQPGTEEVSVSAAADSTPERLQVEEGAATTPQRDVVDLLQQWLFGRRVEPRLEGTTRTGLSWSVLPTLSYNPVYGFALGGSATGAGTIGSSPGSRPSALSLSANYSTQGQFQALLRTDLATPSGDYLFKADLRYLDTDRSTWGLGPIAGGQQEYPMRFRLVRTYATVFRRTAGATYVGVGYHFDDFADIVDERAVNGETTPFTAYSGVGVTRTRASGLSINLLSDTRDSLINPLAGFYLSGSFRAYAEDLGSDRYWQELWVDVRMYPRVPKKSNNVLGFWIYSWLTFGPGPYLNLPAVGWDTYGRGARGYLQGRIRSANQIYLETEYRFQLTRDGLLGGVVFYNGTASTLAEKRVFGKMDQAGGIGIRIKFNKNSRANLALDRAWGAQGAKGWFMGMSEVF